MKIYLCLLSLLPTVITASPNMELHRSTHIELIEKRAADSNVAERHYETPEINMEHEGVESSHRLEKRLSPICSEACGEVETSDCLPTLAAVAKAAELAPDAPFCLSSPITTIGIDCVVSLVFPEHQHCISNKRLAGLAQRVFNDCINDPKIATGGCFILEDTGRVCLGSGSSSGFCTLGKLKDRI